MDVSTLKNLKSFRDFDVVPEAVFIQNATSRAIVYMNPACHQIFDQQAGVFPTFDDRFLSLRAFASEIEGKPCLVQIAAQIQPHRAISDVHEVRVAISDVENILRTEMSSDFLFRSSGRSYHESLIDRIVLRAMSFYDSPLAQLVSFSGKNDNQCVLAQYDLAHGLTKVGPLTLDPFVRNYHNLFFKKGYSLLSEDVNDFACFDDGLAATFVQYGVTSLINIPFFTEGKLSGFLVLANPKNSDEQTDFFFADFATNAIGTMSYRGILYSRMYLDEITGFPWSNSLDNFYDEFAHAHQDHPIVVFEFDFLHFRMLTRTYGVAIGDAVLRKMADILRSKWPSSLLSRKNGTDVFIVATTGIAEAIAIEANRIIDEIQQAFPNIMMTLCFGIYQVKDTREEFGYSVLKASFAHRYAKDDPLNRVKIYDEDMDMRETLSVYFANHFRASLENGEFLVYIQPKYNLENETFFGGEALVRWRLGDILVPPNEFIPQFEANGLTRELDLYVLKKTCSIIAGWLKESPEKAVPISVNFSRVDFTDPQLFESILFTINEAGIPTSYIEIEITESAYVDYEKQIITFMQKCHAAGIKILMDDFGSGVSSFNSLKNLDIDCIKLDYKFLTDAGDNHKKRKIIEGIVSLARSIRIPVVVEGIETKTEAAFFRSLGVRYVQGFLFGKAMPPEQFAELNNRSRDFVLESGNDSRMLLNELLDTNSNLTFLMDRLDLMTGVYRFDGNGLYPVVINHKLEQFIASRGVVDRFLSRDLLSFFTEEKQKEVRDCLGSDHRTYVFSEKKLYQFHNGDLVFNIYMQGLLIQSETDGSRYYLLSASDPDEIDQKIVPGQQEDSLRWLLSSRIQGCAILNGDGKIVAYNNFLKERYPSLDIGMDAEVVFRHRFDDTNTLHRAYLSNRSVVFDVATRKITYKGEVSTLLIFSELGDPGSYISEIGGDGFKYYDRLVASLHTIAVCYVEIDLEGDTFFQVNFKDHDDFAYHDAINHGSYTADLYQRFLNAVAKEELPEVRDRLERGSLIEACKAMSPFTLSYKLAGEHRYHRTHVKFYFDHGHHYACFFLEDTTEERMRDYDRLTGCLGRTAGLSLMDRHINDHPLDKMAFFILDIDDFKLLNDTYGHPLGDRVLAKVHDAFKTLPNSFQFLTRLGGDEFCMLLNPRYEGFDIDSARVKIDEALRDIGFQVGLNKEIHASIGCALIPEDGGTVEQVYPKADQDLYDQKKIRKAGR